MSYNSGSNFNGQNWFETMMDTRTRNAVRERRKAFETEHRDDSDEQLLRLMQERAESPGGELQSEEFLGNALVIERFGSWEQALAAAGLRSPEKVKKFRFTRLYEEEYARQLKLYRAERDAKRSARRRRAAERERRKAEERQREDTPPDQSPPPPA